MNAQAQPDPRHQDVHHVVHPPGQLSKSSKILVLNLSRIQSTFLLDQYLTLANAELRGHVCVVEVEPEQDLQLRDQARLWDRLWHLLLVHPPAQLHGD